MRHKLTLVALFTSLGLASLALATGVASGGSSLTPGQAVAGILGAGRSAPAADESIAERAAELGDVRWRRDHDRALQHAAEVGKPVMLLFQEVPGCKTCVDYGQLVLSHPLIVEAAEELFVPVVVYNNKREDAALLERYEEPSWNNPVLRFVDPQGRDLIPREDRIWALGPTTARMIDALRASGADVPSWLELVALENNPEQLQRAAFAMDCFWVGEARLGALPGVVLTRPGWIGRREVVDVRFAPEQIDYATLIETAQSLQCATRVYAMTDAQHRVAQQLTPRLAERFNGTPRDAQQSDEYHRLKRSPYGALELTPAQKTKVNAALGRRDLDPRDFLSPRQQQQLTDLASR